MKPGPSPVPFSPSWSCSPYPVSSVLGRGVGGEIRPVLEAQIEERKEEEEVEEEGGERERETRLVHLGSRGGKKQSRLSFRLMGNY